MKKTTFFEIIIVIAISICLVVVISNIVLDNKGKINQGNFRINDLSLMSSLDVKEVQEQKDTTTGFDSMSLNLSERNNISFLVANQIGVKDIYIDNISIKKPKIGDNLVMYQNSVKDENFNLEEERVAIYPDYKEGEFLVSINLDNVDFMKDVKIPDGTNALTFDGTMLKILDVNVEDLKTTLQFNLNIVDENSKLNVCKFKFDFPSEDLVQNGVSIRRKNIDDFKFSIESNIFVKIKNKITGLFKK